MRNSKSPTPADGLGTPEPQAKDKARNLAEEIGLRIVTEFGAELERRDRLKIATAFRRQLIPPRPPGRRPKEAITAAHRDWKAGVRGLELFRRHIPDFDKKGHWRRKGESQALMDAIRTRHRRERRRRHRPETTPA
jgi:hypothetical protein